MKTKVKHLLKIIISFSNKLREDEISAFSAQAAFFLIISFFPFAMFLFTLMNYLPFSQPDILNTINHLFPNELGTFFSALFSELSDRASGAVVSVTVVAILWAASKGFYAIINGLDAIYPSEKKRSFLISRLSATLYTLLFAVLLIVVLIIFVFGNQIYILISEKIPFLKDTALLIVSGRTLIGLAVLILFFTMLYRIVPNHKTTVVAELPGAVVTSAGWLIFSYLFSFYIDHLSNYTATYGSLTAIVLFMLWTYTCMYLLFIGAELNDFIAQRKNSKT